MVMIQMRLDLGGCGHFAPEKSCDASLSVW
jgi:hypothetical protein